MGTTNHGTQEITIAYYEEATSFDVNKRNIDIISRGIYSGGYLTKVSNTEVTISPFSVEIGDDDIQISVKTSATATLNAATLDSGDIDESTPYLVLRWGYSASQNNYVEIHAIASVSVAQDNDIIIGKCVFSGATLTGFDYTYRTFLNVQNLFLKVIADSGMNVWIRAGRIHTGSGYVTVPEQQVGTFSVPTSPNSRIDLVYIDTDGTVSIQQGTEAVSPSAPNYNGKLVVAQVLLVNGDTSIPASRITDSRSFISVPALPDNSTLQINSSGKLALINTTNPLLHAWGDINSNGSILASFGISGITRISTGYYRISWSTAFSSTSYAVVLTPWIAGGEVIAANLFNKTTTNVEIKTYNGFETAIVTDARFNIMVAGN